LFQFFLIKNARFLTEKKKAPSRPAVVKAMINILKIEGFNVPIPPLFYAALKIDLL
jgi:hypothetical protein